MKRANNPNSWMREMQPEDFPGAIRDVFDFLCREHGFREPVVEQTPLTLSLSYLARHVAIDVVVDFRDRVVEVALVSLSDGKRPDGWKIDATGRQFMIRLYEAAWHRKLPNPRVTVPADCLPQSALRLWLEAWANQIRIQFADVLADSDALFHELNEARRQLPIPQRTR
jgi:hypothetical protein